MTSRTVSSYELHNSPARQPRWGIIITAPRTLAGIRKYIRERLTSGDSWKIVRRFTTTIEEGVKT